MTACQKIPRYCNSVYHLLDRPRMVSHSKARRVMPHTKLYTRRVPFYWRNVTTDVEHRHILHWFPKQKTLTSVSVPTLPYPNQFLRALDRIPWWNESFSSLILFIVIILRSNRDFILVWTLHTNGKKIQKKRYCRNAFPQRSRRIQNDRV
jgi:hypothetical protein